MPDRLVLGTDRLLPVQAFFNALPDSIFLKVIAGLLQNIGASINDVNCKFSSDLDPDELPFEGVRFSLFEDQVIIPYEQLKMYINQACISYAEIHPDKTSVIADMLGT